MSRAALEAPEDIKVWIIGNYSPVGAAEEQPRAKKCSNAVRLSGLCRLGSGRQRGCCVLFDLDKWFFYCYCRCLFVLSFGVCCVLCYFDEWYFFVLSLLFVYGLCYCDEWYILYSYHFCLLVLFWCMLFSYCLWLSSFAHALCNFHGWYFCIVIIVVCLCFMLFSGFAVLIDFVVCLRLVFFCCLLMMITVMTRLVIIVVMTVLMMQYT